MFYGKKILEYLKSSKSEQDRVLEKLYSMDNRIEIIIKALDCSNDKHKYQATEIIRELIINQIECNDCCACNTPTYEGNYIVCQEHKGKNIDNLGKALAVLDQLEAKLQMKE